MKTSEQTDKIFPDFFKAQMEMKKITKDSHNPHFKSDFAGLEVVIDEAKPIYQKYNIVMAQYGEEMESGDGIRLITFLLHISCQWMELPCPVFMSKKDANTTGSAISYGRRYGLKNTAMLVEKGDDDDGAEASDIDQKKRRDEETLQPITLGQIDEAKYFFDLLNASDNDIKLTCVAYSTDKTKFKKLDTGIRHIEALMKSEATAMIKGLNKKATEKGK